MAYVFGDVLICDDATTAKAVTFHPQIQLRSVTVDGDAYDPSGTISGGSAPTSSGLLIKVQEIKEVEGALNKAKSVYQQLEQEDRRNQAIKSAWSSAKRDLDIKTHEVSLLEQQIGGSNASRVRPIPPLNSITPHYNYHCY
jgi:structural maintenance of chromosome 2